MPFSISDLKMTRARLVGFLNPFLYQPIAGTGIGEDCIRVYVYSEDPGALLPVPKEFENVRIETVVTGELEVY